VRPFDRDAEVRGLGGAELPQRAPERVDVGEGEPVVEVRREGRERGEGDGLRAGWAARGLEVMDSPDGTTVRPRD